jgi:hypothetical protein
MSAGRTPENSSVEINRMSGRFTECVRPEQQRAGEAFKTLQNQCGVSTVRGSAALSHIYEFQRPKSTREALRSRVNARPRFVDCSHSRIAPPMRLYNAGELTLKPATLTSCPRFRKTSATSDEHPPLCIQSVTSLVSHRRLTAVSQFIDQRAPEGPCGGFCICGD